MSTQPESQQVVPEITSLPVQIEGAVVKGPDGRPWVALKLGQGVSSYTLAMPESVATEVGALVQQVITEVSAQARRAKLGLLVPGMRPANGGVGAVPLHGVGH